jgi:mannonate dehydratase
LQLNRLPVPLVTLLRRRDLHHRLINGSDYPLPAINILVHTRALVAHGLITEEERGLLNEIYGYDPLLFDFVAKRTLRLPRTRDGFPPSVFLTHRDLPPGVL